MSYKSKVIYITVIDFSGVASSDADKAAFKLSSDAFKELFGKDSLAVG